jgi:hypothetical protein
MMPAGKKGQVGKRKTSWSTPSPNRRWQLVFNLRDINAVAQPALSLSSLDPNHKRVQEERNP